MAVDRGDDRRALAGVLSRIDVVDPPYIAP
jgi:hypothetical protein